MTPAEASLRGRVGAFVLHSRYDPKQTTQRARSAFLARFEREVDPEGKLPAAERARRAEYARKAHFARLALKSAQARAKGRKKKAAVDKTAAEEVRGAGARPSIR